MTLAACLPEHLRAAAITRIATGQSGAGVYRVGETFVLKVAATTDSDWARRLPILRAAAEAGVAPRIVHVDEVRQAIVSELVVDRSFPALLATKRDEAIALLGRTLRRVHELPLPDLPARDSRDLLAQLSSALAGFAMPSFVGDAVTRVLAEAPPPMGVLVLGHNDVNPTNMAYDGERLVLLDWDAAGANDAFYDFATAAMFLRLDDATCVQLLEQPALPARFIYDRRLVAVLCGVAFLHLARQSGHAGASDARDESLANFYQRLRAGEVNLGAPDGRWAFGLALVRHSLAL